MRPNVDFGIESQSNMEGREAPMTIDQNSLPYLMSTLTNLYSNPTAAVIREPAINAIDSHAEAGNRDPIEILLPSDLAPVYKVIDRGVGMSVDDLLKVYNCYGYSTKRHTDTQSGMLGLGSKAPLTYAPQFTIVAVQDGVKATAVMARDEQGTGFVRIVDTAATDEPNGVEFSIGVRDIAAFNAEAQRFFRFWEPGSVLVNGKSPEPFKGLALDDDITLTTETDRNYVVMGNVPYRIDSPSHLGLPYKFPYGVRIVARIPMGSVNFTPSREDLHYTDLTKETLRELGQFVTRTAPTAAERYIDAAPSHTEAIERARQWASLMKGTKDAPFYRGVKVPVYTLRLDESVRIMKVTPFRVGRMKKVTVLTSGIDIKDALSRVHVRNYTNKTVSTRNMEKMLEYCRVNGITADMFLAYEKPFGSPWLDGVTAIDWNDVKNVTLASSSPPSIVRTTPTGTGGTYSILLDNLWKSVDEQGLLSAAAGKRIIFFSPAQDLNSSRSRYGTSRETCLREVQAAVRTLFPDDRLVRIDANRWDKLKALHPNSVHIENAMQQKAKAISANLGERDVFELCRSNSFFIKLTASIDKIDDPEVRQLLRRMAAPPTRTVEEYRFLRNVSRYVTFSTGYTPFGTSSIEEAANELGARYPLIGNITGRLDNVIDYINALYHYRRGARS